MRNLARRILEGSRLVSAGQPLGEELQVDGYRLRVRTIAEVSEVLDAFRVEATKIAARRYGSRVAAEAVLLRDINDAHAAPAAAGATSPLDVANATCRSTFNRRDPATNCEITLYFLGDAVLARFVFGSAEFRKAFEARREVVRWRWSSEASRPPSIKAADWEARGRMWGQVVSRAAIGGALRFSAIDDRPPMLLWGNIRRHIPIVTARLAAVERRTGRKSPIALSAQIDRDHVEKWVGVARGAATPTRGAPKHAIRSEPGLIDHADVIEASDGRVFVAVPYAGLGIRSRVFLHVASRVLSVVQDSVSFGTMDDVPLEALDLLRQCRNAILIETDVGGRLLRARHVAIVNDAGLSEGGGWGKARQRLAPPSESDLRRIGEWERTIDRNR